jgi:hypothetical protein
LQLDSLKKKLQHKSTDQIALRIRNKGQYGHLCSDSWTSGLLDLPDFPHAHYRPLLNLAGRVWSSGNCLGESSCPSQDTAKLWSHRQGLVTLGKSPGCSSNSLVKLRTRWFLRFDIALNFDAPKLGLNYISSVFGYSKLKMQTNSMLAIFNLFKTIVWVFEYVDSYKEL